MWTVMLEFSSPHPVPAYFSGIVVAFCAWLHYLLIRGTVWAHVNWYHKKIRIITLNMLEKNRTADIRNDFFFNFIYICIYILLAFVCLHVLSWTKMSLVPRCLPLQWLWCRISAVCMIVSKPRDRFSNVRLIFLHLWTAAGYYQLDPGLSVCSMLAMAGGDSTWIHLFISALTITCTYLGAHHLWKEHSTVSATSLYLSQHCMKWGNSIPQQWALAAVIIAFIRRIQTPLPHTLLLKFFLKSEDGVEDKRKVKREKRHHCMASVKLIVYP